MRYKNIPQGFDDNLIANNNDLDLQPIPLGTNLAEAIKSLTEYVEGLAGIVDGILKAQMEFNKELISHTHRSPFYALDTTPSQPAARAGIRTMLQHTVMSKKDIYMFKWNLTNYKMDYLTAMGQSYINSRYNNTN